MFKNYVAFVSIFVTVGVYHNFYASNEDNQFGFIIATKKEVISNKEAIAIDLQLQNDINHQNNAHIDIKFVPKKDTFGTSFLLSDYSSIVSRSFERYETDSISLETLSQRNPEIYRPLVDFGTSISNLLIQSPTFAIVKTEDELQKPGQELYSNLYYAFKQLSSLRFMLDWEFKPIGNLFPKDSIIDILYPDRSTVQQVKKIIAKRVAGLTQMPSGTLAYDITIRNNGIILKNNEIIPFINTEKNARKYSVELYKSKLNYIRDLPSKQIILEGSHINLSIGEIPTHNVTATIMKKDDGLQLTVDTYKQFDKSTIILSREKYPLFYQDFMMLFKNKDFASSEDFTNSDTKQLYNFLKQSVALWAKSKELILTENDTNVDATDRTIIKLIKPLTWQWFYQKLRQGKNYILGLKNKTFDLGKLW